MADSEAMNGETDAAVRGERGHGTNRRQNNRREDLLSAAARLIARRGYEGTSMRDIAAETGMLPGSLYYHFPSKEALFVAVHAEAVASITRAVDAAIATRTEPWARLEAAVAAHLQSLLETSGTVAIVSPNFPEGSEALSAQLTGQRDAYERKFTSLVEALDLPDSVDIGLFRLMLLGAINWTPVWYRPGGRHDPADIARAFLDILRTRCVR